MSNNIPKNDAMLIDIQYVRPGYNENGKHPDYLYIIWKEISTGKKHLNIVPTPKVEIYFEKPQYRNFTYNKNYERLENLDKKIVPYKDITTYIAQDMGERGKQYLQDCYNTGNYSAIRMLNTYPYVFGADYDVRVWYRFKWLQELDNSKIKPITKGFMDIEVDGLEAVGMPTPLENPIDLVTLIDTTTKQSYTFALIGVECIEKDTSQMNEKQVEREMKRRAMYNHRLKEQVYWSTHIDELKEKAKEMYAENYPGYEFNFYFYKNERKMLVHLFQMINELKLDFIGIWNISFDIPYIIDRLSYLGLDPKQVMCHRDFPVKKCYFKKDTKNFSVKNKSDFLTLSSYTIFYDQMITYAAIRKSMSELRSNKLTYIAQREINDEKLNYEESGNIKTVSYNNYLIYVLYNIKDVLLQVGIEQNTLDLETYYLTSYKNLTPYEDEFKETKKLRNLQYQSFYSQGLIPGMNINSLYYNEKKKNNTNDDDEDETTFEGALVGNPLLIDNFGEYLLGHQTNSIFSHSIDFDMSSFYPSNIRAMNIDPSTLYFKLYMNADQFDSRGGDLKYKGITDVQVVSTNKDSFVDDVGKEFMDNLQTHNYMSTCEKWLNLPSVNEMKRIIDKELGYDEEDYEDE